MCSDVSRIGEVTVTPTEVTFLAIPLLITGIDVLPSAPLNAVVAFGSSTTDGVGSTPNANRRWPDELARRLRKERTLFYNGFFATAAPLRG